jgi:ABC-type multidrug transport system ATPase subunit
MLNSFVSDAIVLKRITKRFGKSTAIDSVTLSFGKGINIVLGPNGAGKSTLLRCIDGLYKVDSGAVSVFGKDPYVDNGVRDRVSLLTDNYALYDYLSVKNNLRFFGRLYGLSDTHITEVSENILRELDALEYLDAKVYTLSRGTKQKIGLCRALINDPDVLLLDEPTAFLDVNASGVVRRFMMDYSKEGRTVVMVTQKIDEATRFDGRIVVIRKGAVIKDTTTTGLYSAVFRDILVNIRLAKKTSLALLKRTPGFAGTRGDSASSLAIRAYHYSDVNRAVRYLVEHDIPIVGVDYSEPILEGLFRSE